jgi:large conductance mechanosensitive channel
MKGGKFINEFREFISRGNVVDLAVGVIIGSSFTAIVNSLVNDIFMPFIGMILGKIDFTGLKYVITPASEGVEEAAIYYGNFIQNAVNFLIVAFVLFLTVKAMNKFNRKKEEAPAEPAAPAEDVVLLTEIRDLLKENK